MNSKELNKLILNTPEKELVKPTPYYSPLTGKRTNGRWYLIDYINTEKGLRYVDWGDEVLKEKKEKVNKTILELVEKDYNIIKKIVLSKPIKNWIKITEDYEEFTIHSQASWAVIETNKKGKEIRHIQEVKKSKKITTMEKRTLRRGFVEETISMPYGTQFIPWEDKDLKETLLKANKIAYEIDELIIEMEYQ